MSKTPPYLDLRLKTCSIELDYSKVVEMEKAGKTLVTLSPGTQLPLKFKKANGDVNGKGVFKYTIEGNSQGLVSIG